MWMMVSNCQPIDVNGHVCTTFLFPVVHYKLFGLKSVKEQVHVSVQHNQVPHIPLQAVSSLQMIPAHYGIICKFERAGIEEGVQQTALGQNDDRGNVVAQSDLLGSICQKVQYLWSQGFEFAFGFQFCQGLSFNFYLLLSIASLKSCLYFISTLYLLFN